MISTGKLSEVE